ncbi:MAG: hypothetical protein ACR2NW_09390 [Thermodesulfobacteriota bacterium]
MGLIDNIRKSRDSWTKRFEEHRDEEEFDHENEKSNSKKIEEEIQRNREKVGVFSKIEKT